ncbi:MAG: hypothetical protein L6Q81_16950 [Bacteroidia bacterium]|nr:hypothetical protein [Bacteroidia bacterium]
MKYLVVILALYSCNLRAQEDAAQTDTSSLDEDRKWQFKSTLRPLIEPTYTIYNFGNRINNSNQSLFRGIESNYQSVGLNFNLTGHGDVGFFGLIWTKELTISFNYFLPVTYNSGDTLTYKFYGSNISINYGKDLFYEDKTFDLIPSYGYGFSSITMTKSKLGDKREYRNPALITNIILESRFNLINRKTYKLLSLGVKGGYQIDCSKTKWRSNRKLTSDYSKYRQTGIFIQGFISVNL